jgi:hypothetical protein
MTPAIAALFFSIIIMWPLPCTPTSFLSFQLVGDTDIQGRYRHDPPPLQRSCYRPAADGPQCATDRSVVATVPYFVQGLAACLIGGKCGEVIIAQPARKLRPIDRFELAVCEFQRFFGRCGAGDEGQGRTDEPCDRGASAISLHSRNRSESPAISDQSLIVRTTLEVGRPSAPAVFICFKIMSS